MRIKEHIPNLFTLANLLCGCFAIVFAFRGDLHWSAYMVGFAAVLDFLDGFMARMLNAHSEIGKQLDSLADMVTFGVVPGIVMFQLLDFSFTFSEVTGSSTLERQLENLTSLFPGDGIPFIAFLIPVFSALRLAKFNIDTRQTDSFIGVPTPANAILICSIPLIVQNQLTASGLALYPRLSVLQNVLNRPSVSSFELFLMNPFFLCGLTLLMSFLMVSNIPLFSLKFKNISWTDNKIRYVFLFLSIVMLIFFNFLGIAFIIILYILLSLVKIILAKKKTTETGMS